MSPLSPAPAEIDADLYDDLTIPARQDAYPRSSRAYVRIDISIRAYWHTLFDAVPQLLDLSGPDGRAIFIPFMEWASEKKLSFNWAYHLWVYEWLLQSEFKDRLEIDVLLKIMATAASRWSGRDRDLSYCGIILGHPSLGGSRAVAGWKLSSIHTQYTEVEQLEFEGALPVPDGGFGYFLTSGFELDQFPGWRPIPR